MGTMEILSLDPRQRIEILREYLACISTLETIEEVAKREASSKVFHWIKKKK